jgi:hypothetical protein
MGLMSGQPPTAAGEQTFQDRRFGPPLPLVDDWSATQAIKDLKSSHDVGAEALKDRGVQLFIRTGDVRLGGVNNFLEPFLRLLI